MMTAPNLCGAVPIVLARLCGSDCAGPTVLARLCWPDCAGLTVRVRSFWSDHYSPVLSPAEPHWSGPWEHPTFVKPP